MCINQGKKLERAKWVAAELKEQTEAIIEHDKDVVENREAEIIFKEKKVYVDKIKYKYISKAIESDCDTTELIELWINPAIEETQATIQPNPL